jgi:hypothetical protein
MRAIRRRRGGGGVIRTRGRQGWGAADHTGGRRGRWCGTLEPPTCIALLRGGGVAPLYAAAARLKTLGAAPPSAAAALQDPLDVAPPAVEAARLCYGAAAPSSVPAAGLGRLDAATPAAVAACCRLPHAGHLDVDATVRADEGDGWEQQCIGGGELKVIDDLGWHIIVFITLISPFDIFTSWSLVPLVPPRKLRRGYPSLKGEAWLRFRTPYYHHQLMLATCAMGLNGLAGPLGLPLAGLYARRLSLLWSGLAHIPIAHNFFTQTNPLFFMVHIVYTILLKFRFFIIKFIY